MSYILEYYKKIENGDIVVGQELLLQLKQLVIELTDLIYQNLHNIKIEFEDSEKRIKFIETQCKHFEAPFAGKPFILEIWQKAFIEAIFAIKIYDEEIDKYIRKYKEILFLVGRKNGKTPLIAAITLAEWFCGEIGTKVLCSSNDYEQAGLMFDAINAMREESKTLAKVTRKNIKGMYFGNPKRKKKKGKFSYQNKGNIKKLSARTGAKEGKNIKIGAVDEVFEMKDDSLIMPIRQALSTQDEPLYFELTTEGFTTDGYLDERLKDARQVLKKELDRPRWLIWMYTQDNELEVWQDESTWVKSNPGLGVIKKWSFLRDMIEEAKTSTSKKAFVLAKDFNIKQNNAQAWLQEKDIQNDLTFDIEDLRGCLGIGGVDLSETTDLTAATVMIMKSNSREKYFITHYFIPEPKIQEKDDDKDYLQWAKDGFITVCNGDEVDYSEVVNWFVMLYKKYKIKLFKIGYDRWGAKSFVKEMEDYGFDMERINQDYSNLSHPMKLLEAELKSNKINYNQNPVCVWCFKNTACKVDNFGRIMPVKVQDMRNRRIDGTLAKLNAEATLDRYKNEYLEIVNY